MSEVTAENINVADIFAVEGAERSAEKIESIITADPKMSALMQAAETVEDVYEIVKKFAKVTLEQLKVLFQKTVDYYQQTKAALADELLDNVVGGSFSSWWSEHKRAVIGWTIFGACVVGGIIAGAIAAGPIGAVAGAIGGVATGASVAVVVNSMISFFESFPY